jgi:hypothetical protein
VKGTISSISVAGVLRLVCNYGKTGVLTASNGKAKGEIEIFEGEITAASFGDSKGLDPAEAVLRCLLILDEGAFSFEENQVVHKKPAGICVENVILESARRIYSAGMNIEDYLMPENEVMKIAKLPVGKKIEIQLTSDEWNLLTVFNGDTNIKSAFEKSGVEQKKAECILYGMVSSGLLRRTRFKIPEIGVIAKETFGNIGLAIVDSEFQRLKIDKARMGMSDLIKLLNSLENSFSEIVGKAKARSVIDRIWGNTK